MRQDRTQQLHALRAQLELSTGVALRAAQRNEFIGKPVTQLEESLRADRDKRIRKEMKKARAALDHFEKACQEAGQ